MAESIEIMSQGGLPADELVMIEEEISSEDYARFRNKTEPTSGGIVIDKDKFAQTRKFAKLYRANGEESIVPFAQAAHYLRKRDVNGNPVFYIRSPRPATLAKSDPCPVETAGIVCGRRLLNQFELIKHMLRKHSDMAPFYLNQRQIDAAMGKVSYNPGNSIPDVPSTAPITEVSKVEELTEEDLVLKTPPAINHAAFCGSRGRGGHYTENCPKCELVQENNAKLITSQASNG